MSLSIVTVALACSVAGAADEVRMPIRAEVFSCGPSSCEGSIIEMEGDGIHVAQSQVGEAETVGILVAATDNLNIPVADYGYVALEADIMIREQASCAGADEAAVPAWVRMVYSDSDGQVRELYRGFYIRGADGCDGGEGLERVRKGKLTRYVSGNLMVLDSPPTAIHYFEFGGSGVAFDATIAVTLSVGSGATPAAKEVATAQVSWGQLKGTYSQN
jgi:hypothetical protein